MDEKELTILQDLGHCYFFDDQEKSTSEICNQIQKENSVEYVTQLQKVLDKLLYKRPFNDKDLLFFSAEWNREFAGTEELLAFLAELRQNLNYS